MGSTILSPTDHYKNGFKNKTTKSWFNQWLINLKAFGQFNPTFPHFDQTDGRKKRNMWKAPQGSRKDFVQENRNFAAHPQTLRQELKIKSKTLKSPNGSTLKCKPNTPFSGRTSMHNSVDSFEFVALTRCKRKAVTMLRRQRDERAIGTKITSSCLQIGVDVLLF